jgi:hypothetical protein
MNRKPKMVKAWAFFVPHINGGYFVDAFQFKSEAIVSRSNWVRSGRRCGPIVRIEVPAPREEKP